MSNAGDQDDQWDAPLAPSRSASDGDQAPVESRRTNTREPSVREYFEQFAWFGVSPDPDQTSAVEFMWWIS